MINMRYSVYQQKERKRTAYRGRQAFQDGIKNRFLMLLVYYRPCITYTLAGFLFDLDQSNVCRDMQKIEPLLESRSLA